MKKLVFSSICMAALSTSAFAALDLTIETNKPWYEQLGADNNESLSSKNWSAGKGAIKTILGGASANDTTTIVGSFVNATAKNTENAANEKDNGYYLGLYNKTNNTDGLQVIVSGLNATAKNTKIDTAKAIQDYVLVDAQLDKASAAAKIYNALCDNNEVKNEKAPKKISEITALVNGDNREDLVRVLLEANKNESDGSGKLSYYEKDDGQGGKILDDSKILDKIKALFDTSAGVLKDYDGTILKEASSDARKLESMKTKIIADINSLVASSKNHAKALHIQEQLNDALAMLDKYTKADEQISEKGEKIQEAGKVVADKFSSSVGIDTAYQGVIKDTNNNFLTTKAEIQKNISEIGSEAMNKNAQDTSSNRDIEINADYSVSNATSAVRLSLSQAIDYLTNSTEGKAIDINKFKLDSNGGSTVNENGTVVVFKDLDALKNKLQGIVNAVSKGNEITTAIALTEDEATVIKAIFKKTTAGDSIALPEGTEINKYNAAIRALESVTDKELQAIITAKTEFDALLAELTSNSITSIIKTNEINKALGELKSIAPAEAKELAKLFVVKEGTAITVESIKTAVATEAEADWNTYKTDNGISNDDGKNRYIEDYKNKKVAEHNAKIQAAADKVAQAVVDSKKDAVVTEALSTLNIQLNNMNKRMGELRGLGGDAGVWLRTWGGKMSNDTSSFTYYSTQLGADKKSSLKNGDLYLGLLAGFDKANSDVKSTSYSFGAYGSYIANNGFFADGVMKFITTSHDRSDYDIANQKSFLASFEGGYRFDFSDAFYVEPSLEFITGRIGEYKSKKDNVTMSVDAFSPVVFKPQAFVGGAVDAFTYRAGVGAVLTAKDQTANVEIKDIVTNISNEKVSANGSTKLGKNNHGFVSLGTSYKATESLRINLGVERSFGGDITNDYEINATVRYGF